MGDLPALLYVRDTIVFSTAWEDHCQRLEDVLQCLWEPQFKLRLLSAQAAAAVSYLGHMGSRTDCHPARPSRRQSRTCLCPPTKIMFVLFWACELLQAVVKNFAIAAAPRHARTREDHRCWIHRHPKDTLVHLRALLNSREARGKAHELHESTHLGGDKLWHIFSVS